MMIEWRPISEWNGVFTGRLCLVEQNNGEPLIEIANPLHGSDHGEIIGFVDLETMDEARESIARLKTQHDISES